MKKEICNNCAYYTAYYKRWSDYYGRLTNGFCRKQDKPQTQFESCEAFKRNDEIELKREARMFKALEQALQSINDISQILKEKQNEKNSSIF